ncbi:hypothetical protein RYX36_012916 [Vicia faba]
MLPDYVQTNPAQSSIARHMRRVILKACKNSHHRLNSITKCSSSVPPSVSMITSKAPTSFSVAYEHFINLSNSTIARKRRKLILDNMKKSRNMTNDLTLTGTDPIYEIPSQVPPTCARKKSVTSIPSNMTHIEISGISLHKHFVSNNFPLFRNEDTLLQSIIQTARTKHIVNHASASSASASHHHIAPDIPPGSHRLVDAVSNSNDGMSLTGGSDVESEMEYEPLVDSHLQGFCKINLDATAPMNIHLIQKLLESQASLMQTMVPVFLPDELIMEIISLLDVKIIQRFISGVRDGHEDENEDEENL